MKVNRSGRVSGFTILELLVSLSLIAILVGALVGGLHLGRRAWQATRIEGELDEGEAAMRALTELISKAFPLTSVNDRHIGELVFTGDTQNLEFVVLSEGAAQRGGLILTKFGFQPSDQSSLMIWTSLYRAQTALSMKRENMRPDLILGHVHDFRLSYFGADAGQPPQWKEVWRAQQSLPKLITVHFTFERQGRMKTLETTVALPLS